MLCNVHVVQQAMVCRLTLSFHEDVHENLQATPCNDYTIGQKIISYLSRDLSHRADVGHLSASFLNRHYLPPLMLDSTATHLDRKPIVMSV